MFEPNFEHILKNMTDKEQRIAHYIRNKQIISKFKSMNEEDFERFKEYVISNINSNIVFFDEIFNGNFLNKSYGDNDKYYNKMRELRTCCDSYEEFLKEVYNEFYKPFVEYRISITKSLENQGAFINYLENGLDEELVKCEKIITLNNQIFDYLKEYQSINVSDDKDYSILYKNILLFDKEKEYKIFESIDVDKVNQSLNIYRNEKRELYDGYCHVDLLIQKIKDVNYYINGCCRIFITKNDVEYLKESYDEVYNEVKKIVSKLYVNGGIKEVCDDFCSLFCLEEVDKKRQKRQLLDFYGGDKYFKVIKYLESLREKQSNYYDSNKSRIRNKLIDSIKPFILYPEFMNESQEQKIDSFDYFEHLIITNYKKQKVYQFLSPYVTDDDELINLLNYNSNSIYSYMTNMYDIFKDNYYTVDNIDDITKDFESVNKKMKCISGIHEEELTVFVTKTFCPKVKNMKI